MFDRNVTVEAPEIPEPAPHSEAAAVAREVRLAYGLAVEAGRYSDAGELSTGLRILAEAIAQRIWPGVPVEEVGAC